MEGVAEEHEGNMGPMICWCEHTATQLGDLSSVASVGVGLFLALAVVQVIGSGGVAKLRRKAAYLREVVSANRMQSQRPSVANVDAELLRLELSLEKLSGHLFQVSFVLIIVSLVGLSVISLAPDVSIGCTWIAAFLSFYLGLPIFIFWAASLVIRRKCASARKSVSECETEVLDRLTDTS